MKPLFTRKELRKMAVSARRGKWVGLVELEEIPAFSTWLTKEKGWICQSPDCSEVLKMYKDGWTRVVSYDGKRTCCDRGTMALWYTFLCFRTEDD